MSHVTRKLDLTPFKCSDWKPRVELDAILTGQIRETERETAKHLIKTPDVLLLPVAKVFRELRQSMGIDTQANYPVVVALAVRAHFIMDVCRDSAFFRFQTTNCSSYSLSNFAFFFAARISLLTASDLLTEH